MGGREKEDAEERKEREIARRERRRHGRGNGRGTSPVRCVRDPAHGAPHFPSRAGAYALPPSSLPSLLSTYSPYPPLSPSILTLPLPSLLPSYPFSLSPFPSSVSPLPLTHPHPTPPHPPTPPIPPTPPADAPSSDRNRQHVSEHARMTPTQRRRWILSGLSAPGGETGSSQAKPRQEKSS